MAKKIVFFQVAIEYLQWLFHFVSVCFRDQQKFPQVL